MPLWISPIVQVVPREHLGRAFDCTKCVSLFVFFFDPKIPHFVHDLVELGIDLSSTEKFTIILVFDHVKQHIYW